MLKLARGTVNEARSREMARLTGKVAVITGAAGQGTAVGFDRFDLKAFIGA
jgi:hypothetical protein